MSQPPLLNGAGQPVSVQPHFPLVIQLRRAGMSEMITLKFLGDGTVECEDPWAFGDLVKGAKASEVPAPAAIDLATFVGLAKVATRIDRLEEIVGRILAAIEGAEDAKAEGEPAGMVPEAVPAGTE